MGKKSTVKIVTEWDIVAARQLGRNKAKAIGFSAVDQARITTAISELARNIFLYAREGEITIERIEENGICRVPRSTSLWRLGFTASRPLRKGLLTVQS